MRCPVKISVVIPVYNVEDYLPFSMQSLLDQTLRDVEFICVNDGSTDNSLAILEYYAGLDDRIKVINKKNGGVSSARNVGLDNAKGKWIMFLDPDDYLSVNACERVWIESEEGPTDIINFGTDIVPKQPKPNPWYYYALTVPTRRYWWFEPHVLFGEPSTRPFIWHQAFKKEFLDRVGARFDEELSLGEDMVFLVNLYPHAQFFAFIEDNLYNYRFMRKYSAMQVLRKNPVEKLETHITMVRKIFEHWRKNDFIEKYGINLLAWALEFVVNDLEVEEIEKSDKRALANKFYSVLEEYDMIKLVRPLNARSKSFFSSLKSFK